MTPANRAVHGRPIGQPEGPARRGAGGIGGSLGLIALAASLLFLATTLTGATVCDFPWVVQGKVVKVIDGDTLDVEARIWFGTVSKVRVRLARVDCPELKAKDIVKKARAMEAKTFTEDAVLGIEIKLAPLSKDSFGRVLGEVFYSDKTGKQLSLSDALYAAGLAQLGYDSGRF